MGCNPELLGESADVGASQPEAKGDRRLEPHRTTDSPKQWLWAQGREPRPDREAPSTRIGGPLEARVGVVMGGFA